MNWREIVQSRRELKVAVLGDIMCDEYLQCDVVGLSPESDMALKLQVASKSSRPGGAANVALNLKALGAGKVDLYGHIGPDQPGMNVRAFLKAKGVELISGYLRNYMTTTKSRVLTRQGRHVCRLDVERVHTEDEIMLPISGEGKGYDVVVVSDYAKGVVNERSMSGVRRLGVPFFVDPKRKDFLIYQDAEAITPNENEAAQMSEYMGLSKVLVITRGGRGCMLESVVLSGGSKVEIEIPVAERETGDPTGCGDSFLAGLVLARIACKESWLNSCIFANACGAVAFDFVGARAVTLEAVLSEIERHPDVYAHAAEKRGEESHEANISGTNGA
jgi:D-beta-D-heptose 7-phosphate kinase/D-beta-D-heptose 1-phosphate adenosyltransferase